MQLSLCLSGGGYRASIYHLGVLTFLNDLKLNDGSVMLDHIHSLSCISGGALTGMKYILTIANGENRKMAFRNLYKDIVENNLGAQLLQKFEEDSNNGKALIQSLANIYDEKFFHGEKFEKILNAMDWDGVHHFYVDATDFDVGLPFRFQATVELKSPNRKDPYGKIGNWRHSIDREEAKKLRLADIMAATSCFPLVFEPILYPTEFEMGKDVNPKEKDLLNYPLMDGGLIDNQGVEPAYHVASHLNDEGKELDLAIISDAGITSSQNPDKGWNLWNISPKVLFCWLLLFGLGTGVAAIIAWIMRFVFVSGCLATLFVVCLIAAFILNNLDCWVCGMIESGTKLEVKKSVMWTKTFRSIGTFLKSRVISAYRMTDVIMSGNQKRLWFRALHNDPIWKNRILMNSMTAFSSQKTWKDIFKKQPTLDKSLRPTRSMLGLSSIASSMKTTLWFDNEELEKGVPQAILACGRYTTCWNLLVHIDKLKQIPVTDRSPFQKTLIAEEENIKNFWMKFVSNPKLNVNFYAL